MEHQLILQTNVHLFEEHSSALPIWWAQHSGPRTIVYLDAHLDLQKTDPDSLAALKACSKLEEVRALEAPDHLNPSTRYAFGIENFLYPAHQLNLFDRLVWVAPPHIPRQYSRALIDYTQQMDGISFDELISFRELNRRAVRGTLLGLDITICDYDDLESLNIEKDFYLDIDIDYFVDVPSDRLWIDPAKVITAIIAQLGKPQLVTISRAVSSGFTPVAFRFVGDYIYSLLTGQKSDFDYYENLIKAIRHLSGGDIERGWRSCERLIEEHPKLAPAYYILALSTTDVERKNRLLEAAKICDRAYGFDLAREAIGLLRRKKTLNVRTLQQLSSMLNTLRLGKSQREQAEVALAQVLAASGDVHSALSLLAKQSGDYVDHEDVLLSVSMKQLDNPAKREQNRKILNKVSNGTKYATVANLYLGDLEFANQDYQAALERYMEAHSRAPAWTLPLERMRLSYQRLGLSNKAKYVDARIENRRQRLEQVIPDA